jgi:hypothetical protein
VRAWATEHRGPLAVTLAFLILGALNLIFVPPFAPRDESSHVAYALDLTHGRIPRLDDTNPRDAIPGLQPFKTWTANHPPLYYALGTVPLEAAKAIDEPLLGVRGMRLINLAFGAVAVLLAGSVGALLLPRWPEAPTLAAAGLGLAGSVPNLFGIAYNDGLGVAASVAILVVGLRILRDGPSRRLLLALALLAAVGSLARFTAFMAIGFAAVLAAIGVYLHAGDRIAATARELRPTGDRLLRSAGAFCLPFAAAAVASGWWYLRNQREYGSLTGTSFIIHMQGRSAHAGYATLLHTGWIWRRMYDNIWGAYERSGSLAPYPRWIPEIALAVGLVCLLVAFARWWGAGRRRPPLVDGIAWTVMIVFALASVWQIVQFYTSGGNFHVRYAYAALPVAGTLSAVAFRVLPGNRRNTITILVIGAAIAFDFYLVHRFCERFDPGADTGPVGIIGALGLVGAFVLIARELRRVAPGGALVGAASADRTARPGAT